MPYGEGQRAAGGSTIDKYRSTGKPLRTCFVPDGHSTSRRSMRCAAPNPKWLAGEVPVPVAVEADDMQPEGPRPDDYLLADAADPHDGERLAAELVAGHAGPSAGGGVVRLGDQVAHGCENQGERVLGHRGVVDARRVEHRHLQLGGGCDVDPVEAYAVLRDDLQPGKGPGDDRPGERVV